jgi:hypothetical protein
MAQGPIAAVQTAEAEKDNAYWRNMIANMDWGALARQAQPQAPVSGVIEPPPQQVAAAAVPPLQAMGAGPGMASAQQPVDPQAQRQQALAALLANLNAPLQRA